jgi:DNA-binding SARP family transcriptional activator/Tfp pilus assembly protein PilF
MDFRILGPLEVRTGLGQPCQLTRRKERILLAALLLNANRPVPAERIIDWLWGERPPASAVQNLHSYVSDLRRRLPNDGRRGGRVQTESGGYLLSVDPGELDADVFEELATQGKSAADEDRHGLAIERLTRALGLWRADVVLDGLTLPDPLRAQTVRLEQLRTTVVEAAFEARLAEGQHRELIPELESATRRYPLREQLWAQRMLALYRSGRQAEALVTYQKVREILLSELGIEPGPDLQRLNQQILTVDSALQPRTPAPVKAAHAPVVPAQLPLDVPAFAGRDAELSQLNRFLLETDERSAAVVISALLGTAGVGKTALAVHWAHQVADRFPDGQLYVNLRGFDPGGSAMEPTEAIGRFLDAFEVPPQRIPTDLEAQAGLYRSLLAGRRVLVVLDNARDADQVRPLLPGAPGCLVVVTSRNELSGLIAAESAHPVNLDVLTTAEARQLLTGRLGHDRVASEPDAAEELIGRCARLPLALAILAARIATHPGFSLGALAAQLRDTPSGLDAFANGDTATDVRAVFSWSYRAMDAETARLFRLLGTQPGPDIAIPAAAGLAAKSPEQVRSLLAKLTHAHLVTEHTPGRYTFHDLLRAYAAELCHTHDAKAERRAAVHRVLAHYLHTADSADRLIMPGRRHAPLDPPQPASRPLELASPGAALKWCEAERLNLVAATRYAAETGRYDVAWKLPYALWSYFSVRSRWSDWFTTHDIGIAAARRDNDKYGESLLLTSIANAYRDVRRYDDAFDRFDQAIAVSREIGETWVEAAARTLLGIAHRDLRQFSEARSHCQRALEIFRANGDQWGTAWALYTLGEICGDLHSHDQAIEYAKQALVLFGSADDQWGRGRTLSLIGQLYRGLGRFDEANDYCRQALTAAREIGNLQGEALALYTLGKVQHDTGQDDAARESWHQALTILEQLGAPQAAKVRARLARLPAGQSLTEGQATG